MTTKGTSVWEQYIEYAVLIVAIAVLGWFAWGAFGTKVEVKQNRNEVVNASNIDERLLEVAEKLERALNRETSPLDFMAADAQHSRFVSKRNESISSSNRLLFPTIDMTAELGSNQDVQSELRKYVSPVIPGPERVRARQWFGTISESEISSSQELANQVEGPPHDTMWVQIAGSVNIDSILESFCATESHSAIPEQWHDGAVDIFDVVIQRQENVDGEWSTPETVGFLDGQLSYRQKLDAGSIDAIESSAIIRNLRNGKQDEIVNPEFYSLSGYRSNQMSTPGVWLGDEEIEKSPLQLLRDSKQKLDDDIASKQAEIQQINKDLGALGGGGSGGRGGDSSGSNDSKIKRLKNKLDRATTELAKFEEQKVEIETEIEELISSSISDLGGEVLGGEIWVWGYDMEIQSGAKYRYRVQLQLANPFFGHKPSLFEEQKQLADDVVIASAQSDWTSPIEVQDSGQWFVKHAKPSNDLSAGDALSYGYISVEVYEFTEGAWAKDTYDVLVGQPLGLDGSDWFVLDVIEDVEGDVVLFQNVDSEQFLSKRPSIEDQSQRWKYIRQQMREQADFVEDEEESDSTDDSGDDSGGSGGPIGGGSGGGAR